MKKLLVLLPLLVPMAAFAQSKPTWKSYTQTGNVADIVPSAGTSDSVAAWLAKKADVINGTLTNPTITGGTLSGIDLSASPATAADAPTSLANSTRYAQRYSVLDFGAKCDGSTDDASAINAALSAASSYTRVANVVRIPGGATCAFGSTINVPANVSLWGDGPDSSKLQALTVNFTPQINTPGSYSSVAHFQLVAGGATNPGYPSSGDVSIEMGASASLFMNRVDDLWIDGPCIGIDMAGNNQMVFGTYINYVIGSGCYGIRVGHNTTQAGTTDPHIINTTIATAQGSSNAPDADLEVEDAGGLTLTGDDFLYAKHGTVIKPGKNQYVTWLFASNTALGDTTYNSPLLIDTNDVTARVQGLNFEGVWASNGQNGPGIEIDNTYTGMISGVRFSGLRAYTNSADGVDVASTVTGFDLEESHLCGNGGGTGAGSAVFLNSGTKKFRIVGNTISEACDGQTTNSGTGINLGGSNDEGFVAGNDLNGLSTPLAVTSPASSAQLVIKDNIPQATQLRSITESATTDLPGGYEGYGITNSGTTITAMTSAWNGRHVTLYSGSALTFATGGASGAAICNAFTSSANVPISATYFGCWYLK